MTKPDNLLTGFILLLMVERRSGNLDHHLNFEICMLNEACRGCFYYTCVENFATANLPEVPVGCNSQQTLASLRSPGPPCIMCVQYHGGDQCCGGYHEYCGGYLEYRGGYLEYRGGVQYHGRYHDKCGGYLEYSGGVQCRGGYLEYHWDVSTMGNIMMHVGGYHEYRGGVQYCGGIPSFEI